MAKVSRSVLKGIVKECLIELLAEGLTKGNVSELNESVLLKSKSSSLKSTEPKKIKNKNFDENTKNVINQTTNDPIMASILADTAKTTLQEQTDADRSNRFTAKSNDSYSKIANDSDPMELFSGSSSNWADLAFSGTQK